jgi:deazaflavin-dependent oxidoreductase (nitroreductase family)
MEDAVRRALETERVVDITTTGRRSGEARRIEIWIHHLDGRWFITGRPGRRGWYANLVANPSFTLHVKRGATADLPSTARAVTDGAERRALLARLLEGMGGDQSLEAWVQRAPLVEVTIEG